jgi:hypothetical protein
MKIKLTEKAKIELKNLIKIQNELMESDSNLDLYLDFSSYDQLLFDVGMFIEDFYVAKEFETLEEFAIEISESEGSNSGYVLERLNKAILFELIEVN